MSGFRLPYVIGAVLTIGLAGIAVASSRADGDAPQQVVLADRSAPVVTVYKSPTCGCCTAWVEYMQASGFEVVAIDTPDMRAVKASHGVPAALGSCHTAIVDGYVIEGHVPASDVMRMLEERPAIAGIAVPGMPIGSPGMEVPGRPDEAYDVFAFTDDGTGSVFASH